MPDYQCRHCRNNYGCKRAADLAKAMLLAWAHDEEIEDCAEYQPAWYHGLEGVNA